MAKRLTKDQWFNRYNDEIDRLLRFCRKKPKWQHLPAGHMRYEAGASPRQAARLYLTETKYGRQICARRALQR